MSDTQDSPRSRPFETLIAARAYEIWQDRGCPNGEDLTHWLQAEAELKDGIEQADGAGTAQEASSPTPMIAAAA